MWLIALIGMATSLFECALAQLYKQSDGSETFRGGPAYFMRQGLGWTTMPVIYSALLLVTIGFGVGNIVIKLIGNDTPQVVNNTQNGIAIPCFRH